MNQLQARAIMFAIGNNSALKDEEKDILMKNVSNHIDSIAKKIVKKHGGMKIKAVKEFIGETGLGLQASKDAIDKFM